jgi:hypothetical protein
LSAGACNKGKQFLGSVKFPVFLDYLTASQTELCSVVPFHVIFTIFSRQIQMLKFLKGHFDFGGGGLLQPFPRFPTQAVVGAMAPVRRPYAALFLPFPIRS